MIQNLNPCQPLSQVSKLASMQKFAGPSCIYLLYNNQINIEEKQMFH